MEEPSRQQCYTREYPIEFGQKLLLFSPFFSQCWHLCCFSQFSLSHYFGRLKPPSHHCKKSNSGISCLLAHVPFLQQPHWIKPTAPVLFFRTFSFVSIHRKCWELLFALADRGNFPNTPLEVLRLPFSLVGKSTLSCLWDPRRKLTASYLAEILSRAVCQYDFTKCSSSAFYAVFQIHTDRCQGAFLSNAESKPYWHRRGRQLVVVINDNLHINRYSLLAAIKWPPKKRARSYITASFVVLISI